MLDAAKRQELVQKLRNRIKQASSNVSTKVEARKGDYGVVISESSIDHFFGGNKVAAIKVAELDDSVVELINSDPQDAAQEILGEFMATFNPDDLKKEAAHEVLDADTADKITQKQLDDQKVKLHPRWEDYYTNITQKQLPEHGQRPGTYDIITEGQFRDERTTFYGADRITGDWKQEDRNIVTEGQFEEGVGEYTDVDASERGEIGSKYDGGLDKQWHQTGEKQLMELLKHHKWTEPLTVTEGKDQLGQQDGELGRLTAEVAEKIIKEALDAFGKTVLSVGITPRELAAIASRLVSDESKYKVLANTLKRYAKHDVSVINKKVAKARHFGKTANTGSDWSEFLAADVLVRQLAKIAYDPRHVVEGLVALTSDTNFTDRITTASETALESKDPETKVSENTSIFQQVLAGPKNEVEGDDSDGRYAYAGEIAEVTEATGVKADNKDEFAKAAASYAIQKIAEETNKELDLVPDVLDVDTDKGVFEIQLTEASKRDEELAKRAARRRQLAKQASDSAEEPEEAKGATKEASSKKVTKKAQMGGAGGMPPAAGPEMGNPAPPAGGGDMGMPPPGEALSQDPAMEEDPEMGGSEPKPPGSICPSCGAEDVDVDNGEFRCNNCGAEGQVHVRLDVSKWPETIQESETEEEAGFGLGEEGEEGMGAEEAGMETGEEGGATLPNVPVAASFRLTPRILEKLASQNIQFGTVCPSCGSSNTEISKAASHKGNDGICWDCMQDFNVQVRTAKGKKNRLYGQYIWQPMTTEASCNGCNRLRKSFVRSLNDYGMSWNEFSNLKSASEQADVILKMSKAGTLDLETAMQEPLPIKKIAASARWKGYDKFDEFPKASCMERIARRFGENATAMSGPCQGKPLADCVCGQLSSMGIYSDGLAAKVASMQAHKNPMVNSPMKTCVAMLVRENNMDVGDACTVCDALRAAYASAEELVIESIAQINPMQAKPMAPKPMAAPGKAVDPATKTPKLPGGMSGAKPMPAAPADDFVEPAPMMDANPMGAEPMGASPMGAEPMGGGMGGPQPKPMMDGMGEMPKPMDDVVTDPMEMDMTEDTNGDMDMSIEMGGDFDDMANEDLIGLGDEGITIKLPAEAMEALQVLMDALQGQVGDEMVDDFGDDALDMGDVTEDTVEEGEDEEGEFGEEEIPGLADETGEGPGLDETPEHEEAETPEFEAGEEAEEEEGEDMEKPMLEKHTEEPAAKGKPMEAKPEAKPKPQPHNPMLAESDEETKTASLESNLMTMKRGTIKTYQSSLDSVFEGLLAQATAAATKTAAKTDTDVKKLEYKGAGEGSKVKVTPAQDSTEVKFKDGGKMGAEEAFSTNVKTKPDIPRSDALMGDEGSDMKVSESGDLPSVPHGTKLMDGEEHYKPEKGNVVDGNQGGGQTTSASSQKSVKTASKQKEEKDMAKKTARVWTVSKDHKYYSAFMKKAEAGEEQVKLTDGMTYNMVVDQDDNIVLVAKKCNCGKPDCPFCGKESKPCKSMEAQNSKEIKKESQTKTPNNVKKLEDDKDLNPSSGPGAGKTHADEKHSLGVDEKKPSEGMNEPSVPEAPNGGQLTREHTYTNDLDEPEFPAGGGSNPEYDTVEKYDPEKQEQILGKENDIAAMASSNEEAVKIAGQLLKLNEITIDELPKKVKELSKASPETLADIKNLIAKASGMKGLRRQASKDSVETPFLLKTSGVQDDKSSDLKSAVQSMFTLNKRNEDYQDLVDDQGNHKLWR